MKRFLAIAGFMCLAGSNLRADMRISMADAMRAAISKVQPLYPPTARQMKIAGQVEIEAVIGSTGEVDSAKALSGNPLLTGPAVTAVEKWKFTPFQADGSPSKAVVVLKFDFKP